MLVVKSGVLYMSWNRATEITSWVIFVGKSGRDPKIDGMLKSVDFGTMFDFHGNCVKVLKVSACRGAELLGYSNVVVVAL